jgi:hypothetical protein
MSYLNTATKKAFILPPTLPWGITVSLDRFSQILIRSKSIVVKDKPKLTDYPAIKSIAKRLNATEAQVLIAWGVQRGTIVIPKSVNEGMYIF